MSEFKVGDYVVPVAKGSFFGVMKLTAVYESHMEAGRLRLNYGHWKHADLPKPENLEEIQAEIVHWFNCEVKNG